MLLARRAINAIIGRWGYELKDKAQPPRGFDGFILYLRSRGFRPDTVIDVGIGTGTPWLYDGFPEAHFELFEALDIFVPDMERICRQLNARYHVVALGAEPRHTYMDVNTKMPMDSTMAGFSPSLSLLEGSHALQIDRRRVEVRRLDDFGPFDGSILLKLDVEGTEIEVLRGASATLARTEVIISEISIVKRHNEDVTFGTFISYVESLGFSLIDFPQLTPLRRNGALAYVDAAFVRTNSPLRR